MKATGKHFPSLVLSFLVVLLAAGCSKQAEVATVSTAESASSAELTSEQAVAVVAAAAPVDVEVSAARENLSEVVVLDVRTPQEFSQGHIDGAINIDVHSADFANKVAQLDPKQTYLVHCAVNPKNGRAEKAMDTMSELGFNNLQNLVGGYSEWSGTL